MTKAKVNSPKQISQMVEIATTLRDVGCFDKIIVSDLMARFGIGERAVRNALNTGGFEIATYQNEHERRKQKDADIRESMNGVLADQHNIDTGTHPYYRAARILDAKPGISAEVREGVCYRNGRPWPAMKFLAEAGVELG